MIKIGICDDNENDRAALASENPEGMPERSDTNHMRLCNAHPRVNRADS